MKELSASEINEAKIYWIKSVQASNFEAKLNFLMKNSQLWPLLRVKQFGLYKDDKEVVRRMWFTMLHSHLRSLY